MLRILAVGKKHDDWVVTGIERYQKRLKKPYDVEWVLLPHSTFEGTRARQEESERLLARLPSDAYVLLLDERGQNFTSPALARLLETELAHARPIVLVIGGAYGVDARIHARANQVWSLSNLVFPHQLVRLIVTEQVYRAQAISTGGAYHHE